MLGYSNTDTWTSNWSYNPYSPDFISIGYGLIDLPMAFVVPPSLTKFDPQLATSWSLHGRTLTVTLRHGMKWQNGQAFTSKDVYDAAILDGTEGAVMPVVSAINVPSTGKISFTIARTAPIVIAEDDILGMTPVPSAEYGRFVTAGLEKDEIGYYTEAATDPTAAAKMPQYKAMTIAFTPLSKFHPASMIGDGPFRMAAINVFQAKLLRSKSFYDASKVHIAGINIYEASTNNTVYPELYSGKVDFDGGVYMPGPIAKKWRSTTGSHVITEPFFSVYMAFHDSAEPLNEQKVRQALAYVIPRTRMTLLTYGTVNPAGTTIAHPDGLIPQVQRQWLTKKEINSLNRYPVDRSKAARLLEQAGMHRQNGRWLLPSGKPFTLSFTVYSGQSNVESDADEAATALSAFGIHSSVDAVPIATWEADITDGTYQVLSTEAGGTDPLDYFDSVFGGDLASNTKRGIGLGPKANVPGLGEVNLREAITQETATVGPGSRMARLTWDWARFVNEEVPYLTYSEYWAQVAYSTAKFVDWPPASDKLVWTGPWNPNQSLTVAFEQGYIRAK